MAVRLVLAIILLFLFYFFKSWYYVFGLVHLNFFFGRCTKCIRMSSVSVVFLQNLLLNIWCPAPFLICNNYIQYMPYGKREWNGKWNTMELKKATKDPLKRDLKTMKVIYGRVNLVLESIEQRNNSVLLASWLNFKFHCNQGFCFLLFEDHT